MSSFSVEYMSSVIVEVLISSVLRSSVFVPLTSIVVLLTSESVVPGVVVPYAPLVIKDEVSDIVVGSGVVVVVVSDKVVESGVVVVAVSDTVVGSGFVLVVVSDTVVGSGVVVVVVSCTVVGSIGAVVVVVIDVVVKSCWEVVCTSVAKEIVCVVGGSSISHRQTFVSPGALQ